MAGGEAEKLTGLSKIFNGTTTAGRANVSFAQQPCYLIIFFWV